MMDVTDRALVAAESPSQPDGLFIKAGFNCPLRTLKCHRARLLSTHTTFIMMDVAAPVHTDPQVSTELLAVQQGNRLSSFIYFTGGLEIGRR